MTTNIEHDTLTGRRRPGTVVATAVAIPLFLLYLVTAQFTLPYHNDPLTNVLAAWNLAANGTFVLEDHEALVDYRGAVGWVTPSPRGPISQYPPGTAILTSPLYVLFDDAPVTELRNNVAQRRGLDPVHIPLPSFAPAAAVAAATTALAAMFVALTVFGLGAPKAGAIATGYVFGLGTGAWTVAADALWQHGPGMMWVAAATWCATRQRWLGAGLAYSMVILTRPPVALVGVVMGLWLLASRRWKDAGRLLAGALPGAVGLLAHNWWLFGTLTVSGGYGDSFTEQALTLDGPAFWENVWLAVSHHRYGLFVFTPIVAVLLPMAVRAARRVPPLVIATAIGGLAVLLLQLKANRASGGGDFYFYRYPLEPLAAAAPFLYGAWTEVWKVGTVARVAAIATTVWSVGIHAFAAWLFN